MHRVSMTEAARALGLTYEQVRRRTLTGELEPGEPIRGKQSVSFRSVAALAARMNRDLLPAPINLEPFEALRDGTTRFHLLGVERAAFLRALEADALEAEQSEDLATAAIYWQILAGLRETSYHWQPERQSWRVDVPGLGSMETARGPATSPGKPREVVP